MNNNQIRMTHLWFHYAADFPTLQSLAWLPQYKPPAQAGGTTGGTKSTAAPQQNHIIPAAEAPSIAALLAF